MEYARNKKAYFSYEILEEYEAGIALLGAEVKSIRSGNISLKEAFATIRGNAIWLTNAHIAKYKSASLDSYDPVRSRKLLLSRSEIDKIIGKVAPKGITLVPLSVYDKKGKIKVKIGVGRGKKLHDKRETKKKQDIARETQRELREKSR
ncbi:MAG: SsrA-binding protein SmpB [Patescibacteria group bacterium]|nr:SsrA-binding protein SmpB [Patescibacteria group bacterium]